MSVEVLLSRLNRVKQTGSGQYIACCPAHDDQSPSLAIKDGDEGRIILHCFAGCATEDVLESIGLEFSDVMPPRAGTELRYKPSKHRFDARQVLECISQELTVACLITDRLAKSTVGDDQDRLILTAGRLSNALKMTQSLKTQPEMKAIRRAVA